MDFTLSSEPGSASREPDAQTTAPRSDSEFALSARAVVADGSDSPAPAVDLPRSYGGDMLCLMPRDPRTLFAYWDIDWQSAFGEAAPVERKVHLRILNADGSEESNIEVEPMAGGQLVQTASDHNTYVAELGYRTSAGEWKSLATSARVNTPPALPTDADTADLATVPFHLSFQRMLELLDVPNREGESLTGMLAGLREQPRSKGVADFTAGQRELLETVDEVIAHAPPESAIPMIAWTRERMERILGFGGSSPHGAFGGSSFSAPR